MAEIRITPNRLKSLRMVDKRIAWCEAELDHGYMVSEASVGEWATQAAGTVAPEEIEKALRAAENTRNRIKETLAMEQRERKALLAWIDAIPKEDVRVSIFLHYAKGYSWEVIAEQYFGGSITYEAVRKMCWRCIRGEHQGPMGRPRKQKEGGQDDAGTAMQSPGDGREGNVSASTVGTVAPDSSEKTGDPCPVGS